MKRRDVGVGARRGGGGRFESRFHRAETHRLAGFERALLFVQALAVDERAVARTEIAHDHVLAVGVNLTMRLGHRRVVNGERVVVAPADRGARHHKLVNPAAELRADENQFGHATICILNRGIEE